MYVNGLNVKYMVKVSEQCVYRLEKSAQRIFKIKPGVRFGKRIRNFLNIENINMKNLVQLALKIAKKAHKGQFRHDGKIPYITHPIAVAKLFKKEYKGSKWNEKDMPKIIEAACLLHDVLEDCTITGLDEDRLITGDDLTVEGIPTQVIELVECLTHQPFETYAQYIVRIKHHSIAPIIKRLDIKHNLSTLEPRNKTQRDKYLLALYILEH